MSSVESMFLNACKQDDFETIQKIIELGKSNKYGIEFDINFRDSTFKMTPLMLSVIKGSRELVLLLLENGANILLKDTKGNNALQLACMKQRFHVIELLLRNNADPNDWNNLGWNSLITAMNYFHEDNSIMLLLLLQAGADPIHKDIYGLSAVDYAVRKGDLGALRILLDYCPKLAENCWSPLFYAAIRGDFDLSYLLLTYGVNPNLIDGKTGTGILHEAVRFDNKSESQPNAQRLKIIRYLTMYGGNPDLKNSKKESPLSLANQKPKHIAKLYLEALSYYKKSYSPVFISSIYSNYSLIRTNSTWTKNDPRFCSTYEPYSKNNNLNTNLIDGNLCSMWSFDHHSNRPNNWVIFDLKSEYSISMIRIYCWKSKEMPNECLLQISNSLDGPWITVHMFNCQMIGTSKPNEPGTHININGFHAISRYWKLVIKTNFGAAKTSFHGVEFFGFDIRLQKLLAELNLSEYTNTLVKNGINQIESLVNLTYDRFEDMSIDSDADKTKLWNFICEFQNKAQLFTPIEWYSEPVAHAVRNQILPPFSVLCKKFLSDSLVLVIHGGGIIGGEKHAQIEPFGSSGHMIAFFKDVFFSNCGKFIIEVKSQSDPELNISSLPIQIFDINDPEYYRTSKFKHHTMTRSLIQQASEVASSSYYYAPDDDNTSTLNSTINNQQQQKQQHHNQTAPEFSFTKAAKAKITSWLTKNMSLRRIREGNRSASSSNPYPARKTSFKIDKKPSFGRKPATTTIENKYADFETLSASVDFSDEEDDKKEKKCVNNVLILTKSDFYPKHNNPKLENVHNIEIERVKDEENKKEEVKKVENDMSKKLMVDNKKETKPSLLKKRNSSRIEAIRSKPLTLPLPLPFPLPPPPPQFSFKSSIPMAPPIEKNLVKGLSSKVPFLQIQPIDLKSVKLKNVNK